MNKISVIIPVFNSEKTIGQSVESVLANDYPDFEVIVIDDGSADNTGKIIESISDTRLKVIKNNINSGKSYGRNLGIKNSSGDIILLLDSDTYVGQDWIAGHAEIHKDPEIDIAGGGIVGINTTIYGKCDEFCNWWTSIPNSKDRYIKKLHLPTNNLSVKRSVFTSVGYFNEDLPAGEDSEFCFRALSKGLKIYFKSSLLAYHYDRDDLKGFLDHQASWGWHNVKMRKSLNMDYSFLMPRSFLLSYLYIPVLSVLFTAFILAKWIRYKPRILLYAPLILLGKIYQSIAITDSLKPIPHQRS